MNEVMTLLTSVSGHAPVNSFSGTDVTQQPFSIGSLFNMAGEPVSDLHSLPELLQRLEGDQKHTVFRELLAEGQNSPMSHNKQTFIATPRQWCVIDIDSPAWDGDLSDQQAMLSYAIKQLLAEFQSTDFWYHFSSSMGRSLKPRYLIILKMQID